MKSINKPFLRVFQVVFASALTLFSVHAFGQTTKTIKGEVLDLSCYMGGGNEGRGNVHYVCTKRCLEKGLPAGILSSDGKVYVLIENHRLSAAYKTAIEHGGDNVTITGRVYNRGGLPSLYVEKIKVND